jgi:hypothetical protein
MILCFSAVGTPVLIRNLLPPSAGSRLPWNTGTHLPHNMHLASLLFVQLLVVRFKVITVSVNVSLVACDVWQLATRHCALAAIKRIIF